MRNSKEDINLQKEKIGSAKMRFGKKKYMELLERNYRYLH